MYVAQLLFFPQPRHRPSTNRLDFTPHSSTSLCLSLRFGHDTAEVIQTQRALVVIARILVFLCMLNESTADEDHLFSWAYAVAYLDLDEKDDRYSVHGMPPEIMAMFRDMSGFDDDSTMSLWLFADYYHWTRTRSTPLRFEQLQPRDDLDRWLHAHWLSSTLSIIANNQLVTSAQMPPKSNLAVDDLPGVLGTGRRARRANIGPWIAEFTTLLAVCTPLLFTGFVLTILDSLPSLDEIAEYEIRIDKGRWDEDHHLGTPHNVLVLWDLSRRARPLNGRVSRETLLTEDDNRGPPTVHMVTTWKWVTATKTASFWVRKDVMDELIAADDKWGAFILLADAWILQPDQPAYLSKCRKLRSWA